jgi:hypothetical protein
VTDDNYEHVEPEPAQWMVHWLASRETPTDALLRKPSVTALLLCGAATGTVLGAANGALCHIIVDAGESPLVAGLCGSGLGFAGGIVFILLRRAVWGPHIGVVIGTVLGPLYGIAPALAVLYQSIVVNRVVGRWSLTGLVMAGPMAGLIFGGLLDRISDAIIARINRSRA